MDVNTYNHVVLSQIGWNDQISSFRIGKGVRVKICSNVGCTGDWDNAVEILGPYSQGDFNERNDWASEIYIYPYNPDTDQYIQVFGNGRFSADQGGIF
jgi:hypothetical protein